MEKRIRQTRRLMFVRPRGLAVIREFIEVFAPKFQLYPLEAPVGWKRYKTSDSDDSEIVEVDADIVVFENGGKCYLKIVEADTSGALPISSGESFKIANITDWTVRVSLLKESGGGHCPDSAFEGADSVEIEAGHSAEVTVKVNKPETSVQSNEKLCKYSLIIERKENGSWVSCTGQGGSPDLIVDPPTGP